MPAKELMKMKVFLALEVAYTASFPIWQKPGKRIEREMICKKENRLVVKYVNLSRFSRILRKKKGQR